MLGLVRKLVAPQDCQDEADGHLQHLAQWHARHKVSQRYLLGLSAGESQGVQSLHAGLVYQQERKMLVVGGIGAYPELQSTTCTACSSARVASKPSQHHLQLHLFEAGHGPLILEAKGMIVW